MTSQLLHRLYKNYCELTEWNIGLVETSDAGLRELVKSGRLGPIRWCPRASPLGSRADPFVWPMNDGVRVIYEEIDRWKGKGEIRSFSLRRFSSRQLSRLEIEQPYHLSYPFILRWQGEWYCIPESARAGGLDLYFWDRSENIWRLKRRLLDGIAILDATLFQYEEIWYLFGTVRGPSAYDTLRIWWSKTLEGEWSPHHSDPAKVDLRSARSAGSFFRVDGRWYRPAQDCTNGYGSGLSINRIDALTPSDFRETTVCTLQPDPDGPYPHGLHTLSVCESHVLVDGKRVGFSAALPAMKAARKIARLF